MRLSEVRQMGRAIMGDVAFVALVALLVFALVMFVLASPSKRFQSEPFQVHHDDIDPMG